MKIVVAAIILAGCTSAPAPDSLEGIKKAQRQEVYRACRNQFWKQRSAGVTYAGIDEFSVCMNYANRVVR